MEPIRIEIAVKAENGQQGNGNAHGAETLEERIGRRTRTAYRVLDRLSESCENCAEDMLRELCRDYADTHDDMKAGKIGLAEAMDRNSVNASCIYGILARLAKGGK